MKRGRPKARLVVAPSERQALEGWTQRPNTAQALALRADRPGVRARTD